MADQIPISQLPPATTYTGLFTIATDANNRSVKVPLEAIVKNPYIGSNGHWFIYSITAGGYVDSGNVAKGATGQSAYDYAVEVLHFDGTIEEWYESMKGAPLTWDDLTPAQKASLKGAKGDDGRGIVNSDVTYAVTENEEADVRTLRWGESIPTVPVGSWLWTRVRVFYSDSTNIAFYTKSQHTANGKSAYELAVEGGYTGTRAEYIDLLVRVAQNDNIWLTETEWDALATKDPNKTYNIYEEV